MRSITRWLSVLLIPCLITVLILIQPQPTHAARGGRIGGGSFRAPSMPRSSGGSYRGGYGGGYSGGYRGGGIGFPFLIPLFGFGGGGLFGFLILMAVAGVLVNAFRGVTSPSTAGPNQLTERTISSVTMVQLQMGLLASAKNLQQDLRQLAKSADTSTPSGLQKILQETTLALLRQPELWVYSNLESGKIPFNSAEATFNRLSLTERSKLSSEITTNVSGQVQTDTSAEVFSGEANETNEFIVITVLLATRDNLNLKDSSTSEKVQESLRIMGSSSSADLIALEIIWQPEGQGDVLSAEELITSYPNLQHL